MSTAELRKVKKTVDQLSGQRLRELQEQDEATEELLRIRAARPRARGNSRGRRGEDRSGE